MSDSIQQRRHNLRPATLFFGTAFETASRHAKLSDVMPHAQGHPPTGSWGLPGVGLRAVKELGEQKYLEIVKRSVYHSREDRKQAVELI
jgi:hypothetical protein